MKTVTKIKQNLIWTIVYNVVARSITVAVNALLLKGVATKLRKV